MLMKHKAVLDRTNSQTKTQLDEKNKTNRNLHNLQIALVAVLEPQIYHQSPFGGGNSSRASKQMPYLVRRGILVRRVGVVTLRFKQGIGSTLFCCIK